MIDHVQIRAVLLDPVNDIIQQILRMNRTRTDRGNAERRGLPYVVQVNFSSGHVEFAVDAGDK